MFNHTDVLKHRILTAFLEMSPKSCTVTNLARTFTEEKYAVSRAMMSLEKEGLLDRRDSRHPELTAAGVQTAEKYAERMDIALNHLLYEGVGPENAQKDARLLSMYCSDETFQMIQRVEERYRLKYILRERRSFDGDVLCTAMRDGIYHFPFIIYREHVKNNNNISMANQAFEHPFQLVVKKNKGIVRLKAREMSRHLETDGTPRHAKLKRLKYSDGEKFCDAERSGDFWQFPAGALQFVGVGRDAERVLHGSVCLKMTNTMGEVHMPESMAVFTVLL